MAVKEDLRVRRTKKALADAFLQLLDQKPFDEITINELCDFADVRRATFYKHYSDKFDFLHAYVYSIRDQFEKVVWKTEKPALTKDYYVAYAKHIISFISRHSEAINNIYKSHLFPSALSIIVEQNFKDTCERLYKSTESGMVLNASVEVISSMCAGGVSTAVYEWLHHGKKIPPDEFAQQIGNVIDAIISPVVVAKE